jgi:hypothetical protein
MKMNSIERQVNFIRYYMINDDLLLLNITTNLAVDTYNKVMHPADDLITSIWRNIQGELHEY